MLGEERAIGTLHASGTSAWQDPSLLAPTHNLHFKPQVQVDDKFWNATAKHFQAFGKRIVAIVKIACADVSETKAPVWQIHEGIIYNGPSL